MNRQARRAIERAKAKLSLRPDDSCPSCGSRSVFALRVAPDSGTQYDGCASCKAFWEREDRRNPIAERCKGCAFTPGSPEQADKERWRQIIDETVKRGGTFYCHKRVPCILTGEGISYDHKVEGGRCTNAIECAGWLEARIGYLQKGVPLASEAAERDDRALT